MEERFFNERGIYYRTNDLQPNRVALVFIHGLSGNSAVWKSYEAAFSDTYDIVSMDLRGHGKSLKPGRFEDYTIEAMASDIAALLDHLHVARYVPISHSLSTIIALELIRQRPGAIAAIFLSPLYGTQKIFLTRVSRAVVQLGAGIARLFSYSNTPGGHTDYERVGRAWDWSPKLMVREIPNTTLHVYLFLLDHLYSRDFDALWHALQIPTLIVHGKRDTISPFLLGEKLASKLPYGELVPLPRGNHVSPLPYNDAPEVRRIIRKYLEQTLPT